MAKEKGGFWVGVGATILYPAGALLAGRRIEGPGLPREGGVLLVMNHVSHLDPVYDAVLVHKQGRLPHFLAKHSLWNVPAVGGLLRGTGQIPVYRGTSDAQQSLRAAHEALDAGQVVVIYPEGTITRDPAGWPMHSRTGIARLALEHDVPVIPAARWGTRDIYDHYRKRFRPFPRKSVVTRFGDPVDLAEFRAGPHDLPQLRQVTDLIMHQVKDLLGQVRDEQAPEGFYHSRKA